MRRDARCACRAPRRLTRFSVRFSAHNRYWTTIAELEALHGAPGERAARKEIDCVNADYRRFIELSPFVVFATGSIARRAAMSRNA